MVDAIAIKATAYSHVAITNMSPKVVTFEASQIGSGKPKSVATEDMTQSLTRTLLGDVELKVNILGSGVGLGSASAVRAALIAALGQASPAIDGVVSNTLNTLGLKIGEADVWANGVICQRAVLVQ